MNENLKRLINASKSCRSAGWIALAAGAVLLLSSDAQAQLSGARWRSGGGWGAGEPYCRHFDTNTVTTISGEVVKVGRVKPLKETGPGIHLELKTEGEPNVDVHLGPAWFIENQDTKILAGDRIQVKGSRTKIEGKPVLIASELRKNEEVLTLRNADGRPVWAGWRRSYGR